MHNDFQQMLTAAHAGDEQALAAVIASFMPAIRAAAKRYACAGLDHDDVVQEGIIALFHALGAYNETRGASFATFARTCIDNAAISAARAATRLKHAPLNTFVPLTDVESATNATDTPEALLLASEQDNAAMQDIAARLSARERQVLALFLDGLSYSVIAQQLCISQKAVGNALQRVRAKLK